MRRSFGLSRAHEEDCAIGHVPIIVTHSYMATKNPAPATSANSVSGMIDPRTAPPRRDALSVSILATSWLVPGVLPLRLLEPYLRLTTLLAPVVDF